MNDSVTYSGNLVAAPTAAGTLMLLVVTVVVVLISIPGGMVT
jgi:energy-converting hydrogenase Eha subunit B